MLYLNENVSGNSITTKIQKVRNFINYIDGKFQEHFTPDKEISTNEFIIKFKGKIIFLTYNSNKPIKWGIRIYILSDIHIYYKIHIYYASQWKCQYRISYTTSLSKCNPTKRKEYHIFTNIYFTRIPLAQKLLKLKCYLTSTIQTNRKYIPDVIKN